MSSNKIAIVTGANGGVGFGICQHLLEHLKEKITLVMACRNPARANAARNLLIQQFPWAHIDIVLVDVSKTDSCISFAKNINEKYSHVDFLFCNAGVLSVVGLSWKYIAQTIFYDPVGLFERSDATIQRTGEVTDEGLGYVFTANVFGHYVMIRELEEALARSGDGRVIWTSSLTADKEAFQVDDWQGIKSITPYESSKRATDLIALAMHERFLSENKPILCLITSPGVVATDIGNLHPLINKARRMAHFVMRWAGVTSQNITAYNGAISNAYAALTPSSELNYLYRYSSLSTRRGSPYVEGYPLLEEDPKIIEKLVRNCETLYQAKKKNSL
ncbi:hypothetical protein BDB01DRAFT_853484 [Pilobolus umbonatus]|nr:hypothetical protein BDB01DRAFT_853484 [Pilobolus umbonatus]